MASKDEIADEQGLFPGFPKSVSCDQCCNDRLTWVFPIALLQIAARAIHHNAVMLLLFADNFPVSGQLLCISCAEVSVISPQATRAHAIPFTDAFGVEFAGPILPRMHACCRLKTRPPVGGAPDMVVTPQRFTRRNHTNRSSLSSTPQAKPPCAPPPCSARFTGF
jgi:hypothetical protein